MDYPNAAWDINVDFQVFQDLNSIWSTQPGVINGADLDG